MPEGEALASFSISATDACLAWRKLFRSKRNVPATRDLEQGARGANSYRPACRRESARCHQAAVMRTAWRAGHRALLPAQSDAIARRASRPGRREQEK